MLGIGRICKVIFEEHDVWKLIGCSKHLQEAEVGGNKPMTKCSRCDVCNRTQQGRFAVPVAINRMTKTVSETQHSFDAYSEINDDLPRFKSHLFLKLTPLWLHIRLKPFFTAGLIEIGLHLPADACE